MDCHGNGLNKLSPDTGVIEVFDKQDGLPSNQFNKSACWVCRNGDILLGSTDGAILFKPDEIRKTKLPTDYETIVYQFDVFNEPVYCTDASNLLREPIYKTDRIELPYNRNFFSFHFVTPNYQTPQRHSILIIWKGMIFRGRFRLRLMWLRILRWHRAVTSSM